MTISIPIFIAIVSAAAVAGFFICALVTSGTITDLRTEAAFYKKCASNNNAITKIETDIQTLTKGKSNEKN